MGVSIKPPFPNAFYFYWENYQQKNVKKKHTQNNDFTKKRNICERTMYGGVSNLMYIFSHVDVF